MLGARDWENGYVEAFDGNLWDRVLNREIFATLLEAKVLIADWRKEYNHFWPHSSLYCSPPTTEARMPAALTL
jgi:transposase InsO family protein